MVLLAAVVAVIWFIATIVNIKKGVGSGNNIISGTPTPTETAQTTPEPTYTSAPTPTPSFTDLLAEEVKKHDKKPVVMIDPGHGYNSEGVRADGSKGVNTGAYVKDANGQGVWEDTINLDIALKLRDILTLAGCEVLMTREGENCTQAGPGNSADLKARRNMANESNADAFISIHQNSSGDTSINGTQVWCNSRYNEFSDELGNLMLEYVTGATGANAIKVYDESYKDPSDGLAIPKANKPTALIECGYMTNLEELANLTSADYQQKMAEGIAEGLFEFFKTVTIWK